MIPKISIAAALVLASACGSGTPTITEPSPTETPAVSASPTPREARTWALVERSKADGTNSVSAGFARVSVPDGASENVSIEPSDQQRVHVSDDGRAIARTVRSASRVSLWSGTTDDIAGMKEVSAHDVDSIPSVLWDDDGSSLYYVTLVFSEEDRSRERLWRVPAAGGQREMVGDFGLSDGAYVTHQLLGFTPDRSGIVWVTAIGDGLGAISGAGITTIATGKSSTLGGDLDSSGTDGVALARDGRTLFWVKDRRVLRARSVADGTDRVIYTAEHRDLRSVYAGPDGSVALQDSLIRHAESASEDDVTVTLVISEGRARALTRSSGEEADLILEGWSPDGAFLWLGSSYVHSAEADGPRLGRSKLIEVATRKTIDFSESEAVARSLIGWIVLDE